MATIDVYNLQKEKTGEMELNDQVFQATIKKDILHQVVVSQLLSRRSGTSSAKGRSEVRRSKSKLYRQKGTGRARAGSASSPTRRGGGVAFGPIPRTYIRHVAKKVRRKALCMALTDKFLADRLVIVNDFNFQEIRTKLFVKVMKNFEVKKALIITEDKNEHLEKSSQNVPWVKVMRYHGLNVYDILNHDHLFMVQPVVPKIEEALLS